MSLWFASANTKVLFCPDLPGMHISFWSWLPKGNLWKPIYEHMSTGWFPHQSRANKQVGWGYISMIVRSRSPGNQHAAMVVRMLLWMHKHKWIMINHDKSWCITHWFVYAKYGLFPNIRQLFSIVSHKPMIVSNFYTSKLWLSPYCFFSSFEKIVSRAN